MRHCREYGAIARRLIRMLPEFEELREAEPRIAYLRSRKEKRKGGRVVFAECCRVEEKYSWCCPYDFFIVVYAPNVEGFSAEQMEILLRHELHHIGIAYTDSGIGFFVKPHDIEDFRVIIDTFGLDWCENSEMGNG